MRLKIIIFLLIGMSFSGCVAIKVVKAPFTIINFALDTTGKAVDVGAKVVDITMDVGSKVIDSKTPAMPPVNINIE